MLPVTRRPPLHGQTARAAPLLAPALAQTLLAPHKAPGAAVWCRRAAASRCLLLGELTRSARLLVGSLLLWYLARLR